jgi:hypothetical protein
LPNFKSAMFVPRLIEERHSVLCYFEVSIDFSVITQCNGGSDILHYKAKGPAEKYASLMPYCTHYSHCPRSKLGIGAYIFHFGYSREYGSSISRQIQRRICEFLLSKPAPHLLLFRGGPYATKYLSCHPKHLTSLVEFTWNCMQVELTLPCSVVTDPDPRMPLALARAYSAPIPSWLSSSKSDSNNGLVESSRNLCRLCYGGRGI